MNIRDAIRTIPDHPKPGIMFRGISTLLGNARAFRTVVDQLVQPYAGIRIDKVAGIEARSFILGGATAATAAGTSNSMWGRTTGAALPTPPI